MLRGYATQAGTMRATDKHNQLMFHHLDLLSLWVSRAGFGGYRISDQVRQHERALTHALCQGINLIDTSANYADGGSEKLVGQVLGQLVIDKKLSREEVVVVSKVGYLQGHNYALSQQRKKEGRPFPELVEYGNGLEHCIHPVFLADQLDRSLARLELETLDFYLLHNPEYYLEWATSQPLDLETARSNYYSRMQQAFEYLESEVERGRIRAYGVSSNTFPVPYNSSEFTSLSVLVQLAEEVCADHHFRMIQLPLNLLESGAVLEANQPDGSSVLSYAKQQGIVVLSNRPLNAFSGNRLIRLADIHLPERYDDFEIIQRIRTVTRSEKRLWRDILPELNLPLPLQRRVKEQICLGDTLKHYWRNFGSYEHWRQTTTGSFWPRVRGVTEFLAPHKDMLKGLNDWITSHLAYLESAFEAIGSVYAQAASTITVEITRRLAAADEAWAAPGSLSQKAIRAICSTEGIASVLVGMRQEQYVDAVVEEIRRPIAPRDRTSSWRQLRDGGPLPGG